jgi:hypothetical protein
MLLRSTMLAKQRNVSTFQSIETSAVTRQLHPLERMLSLRFIPF